MEDIQNQTPPQKIIVLIAIILCLVAGGYFASAYYLNLWPFQTKVITACTQEAKLCPDGSYVGCTGPNCEFAACPEVKEEPEVCIQIITPARNPQTGEVRDFPTPCDVPEGWEIIKLELK